MRDYSGLRGSGGKLALNSPWTRETIKICILRIEILNCTFGPVWQ